MVFVDLGGFEAMKMLSSCKAPHCDKHQFCAKMTVSTSVCEISFVEQATPHFVFNWFLATYMSLADHKATQGKPECLNKLLACL